MQSTRNDQKSPLPQLEPGELELGLEASRSVLRVISRAFSTGSLQRQKGDAGSCYPRNPPVSWIRAWDCWLIAKGSTGTCPVIQSHLGLEGRAAAPAGKATSSQEPARQIQGDVRM